MTSKTTNKFAPEVRSRAVRMVLEHESDHDSRWAAIASIAAKIGCTPETLRLWVKRAERESGKIVSASNGPRRSVPGSSFGACGSGDGVELEDGRPGVTMGLGA